jgi:FkbM family methyltransferase
VASKALGAANTHYYYTTSANFTRERIYESNLSSIAYVAHFMNWRGALHWVHSAMSHSRTIVRLATLARNQFGAVVAARVSAPTCHGDRNGEHLIARTVAPNGKYFVDVGANVGEWTDVVLVANGGKAEVLLFEPNHGTFRELQQKFSAQSNVTPVEAAVSDFEGEAEFFAETGCGRTSSLSSVNARADALKRKVRITTLDHEVTIRSLPRIDMLKIDAEGHDFYVLRGARQLLAEKRIDVVQFEYGHEWAATGATLAGAFNFLSGFGYKTYILRPDGLYDFNVKRHGETFAYANFVAIAPGQAASVATLINGEW